MARRKKPSPVQKIVLISIVLAVAELAFLGFYSSKSPSVDFMEAVKKSLESQKDLKEREKDQAKIQMAVWDYRSSAGRLPTSLNELVPKYFDRVPIDLETGKAFEYKVQGNSFTVGGVADLKTAKAEQATAEQNATAALLAASVQEVAFIYDRTGKRDPFRPFDFSPKPAEGSGVTPLEKFELGQFKLTAVLSDEGEPTGIVELTGGKGFMVKKGTKIGTNGGEVVEIHPNKLVILETFFDFTGQKSTRRAEMPLRTKEQEDAQLKSQ